MAWIFFTLLIVVLLSLDLFIHRKNKVIHTKEALFWSIFWIALSLAFNAVLYFTYSKEAGLQFFTGYLVEKMLSIDNIFVFSMIFSYFSIEKEYRHKVLYWGVIGAIVIRFLFIFLGISLITEFHFMIYVLGAVLLFSGLKMTFGEEKREDLNKSFFVRLCKKILPISKEPSKGKFFIKGKVTTLFLVLIVIEGTDIIFALDSIPAILAITTDPLIVYTSNIFAILGLRSLYFVLENASTKCIYLKKGIALVLVFIGFKMLLSAYYTLPLSLVLSTVVLILAASITLPYLLKPRTKK